MFKGSCVSFWCTRSWMFGASILFCQCNRDSRNNWKCHILQLSFWYIIVIYMVVTRQTTSISSQVPQRRLWSVQNRSIFKVDRTSELLNGFPWVPECFEKKITGPKMKPCNQNCSHRVSRGFLSLTWETEIRIFSTYCRRIEGLFLKMGMGI